MTDGRIKIKNTLYNLNLDQLIKLDRLKLIIGGCHKNFMTINANPHSMYVRQPVHDAFA